MIAAGPATLLGYVAGGRLSDRLGRKPLVLWSSLIVILGVLLVFSEDRWLFVPGFFLLTGADASLTAVRPSYLSELFPTEVRATLLAFVLAVIVASGSLGLVVVGALEGIVSTRSAIIGLTGVMLLGLLPLRRLPETAGTDVVGAASAP